MSKNIEHIFVDLDRALVRTDLFFESIIKLIKKNPINLFRVIVWTIQGRSVAKGKIAQLVDIDVENLPYEPVIIEYLRQNKAQRKYLVLATASHWIHAEKVAAYLGFFDQVLATNSRNNLKGKQKLAAIRALIGDKKCAYCGNSAVDRPTWSEAAENILVNAPEIDDP